MYVPIVTLSTKNNVNLTKQLNEGFKRSVYWNEYKSKIETKKLDNDNITRFPLDAFCLFLLLITVLKMLLVIQFTILLIVQRDSHRKYFLPRVDITNYNVLIGGGNFCDQPINDKTYSMMKLERLQQDKVIIILQHVC